MKFFSILRMLVALGFLSAISISCSDDNTSTPVQNDIRLTESASLGQVLTDKDGKTLYFFSKDVSGTSACSGACKDNWPVFMASGTLKLDAGLNAADFATITRADGMQQTTYKGWPLYYYKNDVAAGDVKGEGVGNILFAAKTNYSVMLGSAQLIGMDGKSYKSDYTEGTGETPFLVDDLGRTLYAFARDSTDNNNFTNNDAAHDAAWPVFSVDMSQIPSTLDKAMFNTITVFGKKQLTYKGWPLYYFGADEMKRGATKGVSVPRPGVWPIVNKDSPNAPK